MTPLWICIAIVALGAAINVIGGLVGYTQKPEQKTAVHVLSGCLVLALCWWATTTLLRLR